MSLRNKGKQQQGQHMEREDATMCRVKTKAIQITMMAFVLNAVFVFVYMTGMMEFKGENSDIIVTTMLVSTDLLLVAFLHFFTEKG